MQLDEQSQNTVVPRLRRIEGQVAGIIRMIEDGRECIEILTQVAAASKALDKVGFKLLAANLARCVRDNGEFEDTASLEKLFMTLA
ncbi:copper-sensing transcriptional repressor CsoR [bacterium BMS3Abin02]|nr:copper-sensing transcriptional repressor CsoR [bacterium BMS3Abin02]GBE22930.1 copper-sensing transcriptional repressor CsoR [bacterium BMS3Bbin01]